MTTFKTGQRVKLIADSGRPKPAWTDPLEIGAEGTIMTDLRNVIPANRPGVLILAHQVRFDRFPSRISTQCFSVEPRCLAPLTDPKADAFVESIKRLKPYEEPKVREPESVNSGNCQEKP